mmetsp:Transcript_16160/g.35802  ORF Transcript_16160/g.35802 Transcript_16160/m.35802 type:complete len:417 (-) Transcript_16160:521-1771(-)
MAQQLNFCARVYQMLECESEEIIQWNTNGLSFRIIDHVRFENELLHKYFKHRKMASVQRQLNAYGFRSVNRGEHKRSFYHPVFKRGNWEGVKQMARFVAPKKGLETNSFSNGSSFTGSSSSSGSKEVGYGTHSSFDTTAYSIPPAPQSYQGITGIYVPTPALAPASAPAPFVPHFPGMPVEFTAAGDAYLSLQPQGGGLFLVVAADGKPLFTVASALHPAQPSQFSQHPTMCNSVFQPSAHVTMGMGIAPSKQDEANLGPVLAGLVIDAFDDDEDDMFAEDLDAVTQLKWDGSSQPNFRPPSDTMVNPITGAVKVNLGSGVESDHHFAMDYNDGENELSPKWAKIEPVDYSIPLLFKEGLLAQDAPSNQPPGDRKTDFVAMALPPTADEEKASPGRPRANSLDDVYDICDYMMEIT